MAMPKHVLLVDEVDEDRDIYGAGLTDLGYQVTVSGYSGAVHTAIRIRPDVVVLHTWVPPRVGTQPTLCFTRAERSR